MGERLIESVVTIALGIVGVATIAVLVSRNSQTPAIIGTSGGAFSEALQAAEAPVLSSAEFPGVRGLY